MEKGIQQQSSSNSTRSNTPKPEEQGDVQAIGKHCDVESCHRLDFLPFKCGSCEGTYCLDHRSETAHSCSKEGLWATRRRQAALAADSAKATTVPQGGGRTLITNAEAPCDAIGCKTKINTPKMPGTICPTCKKQYCLPHRLPHQHNPCEPPAKRRILPAAGGSGGSSAQDKARNALSRFKAWTVSAGKSASSSIPVTVNGKKQSSSAAQQLAMVNALKKEAKGDEKVAADKRIYVFVEAEAKSTSAKQPKGSYYYSKDWSVGRVMDAAAKSLQIPNLNNQKESDEHRLRVFHVEGGRLLSFGEKLGDTVVTGNTLVLLRGLQVSEINLLGGEM